MPIIDEVWQMLEKAQFFASLDLLKGYHQVEVAPEDRAKTEFITHQGLITAEPPSLDELSMLSQ